MATVLLQSIAAHRSDNHGLTNLLFPNMSHLLPSAVGFYCQYPGGEARTFWSIPCPVGGFQPHFCLLFPACFNLHVDDNGDGRNSSFGNLSNLSSVYNTSSMCGRGVVVVFGCCLEAGTPGKASGGPQLGCTFSTQERCFR